jgi:integrase
MSLYRRNGYWYVDYYDGPKRIREKIGTNKQDAETVLGKRLLDIKLGIKTLDPPPRIRIDKLIEEYRPQAARSRSLSTTKYCLSIIGEFFKKRFIDEITEKDVAAFAGWREKAPTRWGKARAGGTINREMTALRSLLSFAVNEKYLSANPASKPRHFEANKRLRFLTVEEAARLLDLARRRRSTIIYPLILLALDTGMRRGEILALRWDELDFVNNRIWVRRSKNGEPRHIPMTARVREALQKHPRRIGHSLVFVGRTKAGRVSNGIREVFVDLLDEAGIKDFTFHDLRHTFASHLVMAGVDLYAVAKLLGHKDVKQTQRYAHLSPAFLAGTVDVLSQWRTGHQSVTGETIAEKVPVK